MDNFMDKLAQKLTAQEMIKANSAADTAELERLQKQLAQYDACLQEMRKLSLKNVETTDKVGQLLDESIQKIQEVQRLEEGNDELKQLLQDQTRAFEEIRMLINESKTDKEYLNKNMEELRSTLRAMLDESEEHVHKENVRVYRNVQAVVVGESKKLSEDLEQKHKKLFGMNRAVLVLVIITMLASLANAAVNVPGLFNIKLF